MKIGGIYNQALLGIQRGLQGARTHAGEIASAEAIESGDPSSLAESLVGLKQDELQVKASAKVFRAMDAMVGVLIDEET
jgi:hypothetical protein